MTHAISIVIPAYNRPRQLDRVLDCLLASETEGFCSMEIVVVDDGSTVPLREIVEARQAAYPFSIRYVSQPNSGPAKARNTGFGVATNDIVLFIDDDILAFPDLVSKHFQAHQDNVGSVVFGQSPFVKPERETSAYRYLAKLLKWDEKSQYQRVNVVASGNISVERQMFLPEGVYRGDLRTPAAEEFELEHRLNSVFIPIVFMPGAAGWHLQPTTIEEKCKQEFKYGVGASEAWIKIAGINENEHLAGIALANGYASRHLDSIKTLIKKILKSVFSAGPLRKVLLMVARRIAFQDSNLLRSMEPLIFRYFSFVCGIYLFSGFRAGLKQFSTQKDG